MFGSVGAWFYKALAGINLDPLAVAFEKIRLEPQMVRDLMFAAGSVETIRGRVVSSWKRSERGVSIEAVVPVGSEAEIVLPKFNLRNIAVSESGKAVWADKKYVPGAAGVLGIHETAAAIVIKTGSGRYVFELKGE
jgi:alpha-L-rhamnosidase